MADYYSILSRAVASLNPNTAQARAKLYQRARDMLIAEIENNRDRWTNDAAVTEVANFDAATDRIEADITRRSTSDMIGRSRRPEPAPPRRLAPQEAASEYAAPEEPKRGISRVVMLSVLGLLGVAAIGVTVYAFRGGPAPQAAKTKGTPGAAVVAKAPEAPKAATTRPALDGDDLDPGVDGGSTDAGLPYYLRRQAVYYRTVYTPGMVVVDRSQRFLYLVQPQARALRYGIGVGGECDISAGLYRIKSKSPHWPEWSPSASLLKRRNYPPKVAGGPGNPLGAYALYFESNLPGIHGTNAPKSIGQAPTLGCFRLINDDITDLEKRVAIGTGVVVLN